MKIKVTFLFDKTNLWIKKYFIKKDFINNKSINLNFSENYKYVKNQDIVIPISYTKILSDSFFNSNKLVVGVHPSNLPRDKGFAPVQNQILKNRNKIYLTFFQLTSKTDSGPIYFKNFFKLVGNELHNEVRKKQALLIKKMIIKFLNKYPNIKKETQKGKSNFNKRRYPEHNKLNINKSIKKQFNLLRVSDNEKFPAYFIYKKHKYVLKIYKYKKLDNNEYK